MQLIGKDTFASARWTSQNCFIHKTGHRHGLYPRVGAALISIRHTKITGGASALECLFSTSQRGKPQDTPENPNSDSVLPSEESRMATEACLSQRSPFKC